MKEIVFTTNSIEETHALGEKIGKYSKEGFVILLDGDLGAGKTTLTQGIAKGLDIEANVTSPTFTIQKIYEGRLKLYHFDAYRLEGIEQDLGFEEYIDGDGVVVIEWGKFIPNLIPEEYLAISIKLLDEDSREFTIVAKGKKYEELVEAL